MAGEHGAAGVIFIGRRHCLVGPRMIDYMNYRRPVNASFAHPVAGSGVMIGLWQTMYLLAGATPPECWAVGKFRPDGHTVSVSDMYFVAHFLQLLDTRCDVVQHINRVGVCTRRGSMIVTCIDIQALGFESKEGSTGVAHMSQLLTNY